MKCDVPDCRREAYFGYPQQIVDQHPSLKLSGWRNLCGYHHLEMFKIAQQRKEN